MSANDGVVNRTNVMSDTDLHTELAALIAEATYEARFVAESMRPAFIAERLETMFQQVGWHRIVPANHEGVAWQHAQPADTRTWEPVYRVARSESKEGNE